MHSLLEIMKKDENIDIKSQKIYSIYNRAKTLREDIGDTIISQSLYYISCNNFLDAYEQLKSELYETIEDSEEFRLPSPDRAYNFMKDFELRANLSSIKMAAGQIILLFSKLIIF